MTRFGAFELDLNAHRLSRDGKAVPLTSGEFDLLVILVAHPNKVLDRDRLLDLLTGKPVLYLENVDETGLSGNAHTAAVEARAKSEGAGSVRVCAKVESEVAELDDDEKKAFLDDLGLEEPGQIYLI